MALRRNVALVTQPSASDFAGVASHIHARIELDGVVVMSRNPFPPVLLLDGGVQAKGDEAYRGQSTEDCTDSP